MSPDFRRGHLAGEVGIVKSVDSPTLASYKKRANFIDFNSWLEVCSGYGIWPLS